MGQLLKLAQYYIGKIPFSRMANLSSSNTHIMTNGNLVLEEKNGILKKNGKRLEEGTAEYILAKAELDGTMKQVAKSMEIFKDPRFPFI